MRDMDDAAADDVDPELVWALQEAATSDRDLDGWALAAAARVRAQVIRRRRRRRQYVVVGAGVAVGMIFTLPVAVSLWPTVWPAARPAQVILAQPPAAPGASVIPTDGASPLLTVVPDAALLDTQAVSAVVGDAQSLPAGDESTEGPTAGTTAGVTAGFCRDDAYTGYDSLQVSRSLAWAVGRPSPDGPMGQSVTQDVLVFVGDGAQEWFTQTSAQAADCAGEVLEASAWTVVGGDAQTLSADQSLVAYAQVQIGEVPLWQAVVTARRGDYVVQVRVETYGEQSSDCVGQAVALAEEGLQRMAAISGS